MRANQNPRPRVPDSPGEPRSSRRDFVSQLGAGMSAAVLASLWPQALADAAAAEDAAALGQTPRYKALTAAQANDFGAIADRIIPPDDTPGARAAGVVFFTDRMLVARIAAHYRPAFDKALLAVNTATREHGHDVASFSALTTKQQDEVLTSIETTADFEMLRRFTIWGYFSHPSYGGNRDKGGWKTIGFEDR